MGRAENRKAYRERHSERDKQARREAKARWIERNPEKHAEGNRARAARYRKQFPEKVKAGLRAHYRVNKDKFKDSRLQREFGITLEGWYEKFERQGRRCGCCGSESPLSKKGWQTDHCHFSGRLRSIICAPCNITLSEHFQLNAEKFAEYLHRHRLAELLE